MAPLGTLWVDVDTVKAFRRLSLSRQFLVASFPILLGGMVVIGLWVAREIEQGVVNRLGAVTSLYVDSFVAPHLQYLLQADRLDASHRQALDALLSETQLGQKIVAFNIWRPDGRILYSTSENVIGQTYPVGEGLATALRGDVYSRIIDRSAIEHGPVDNSWPSRLIETYTPVHAETLGKIVGAAEFYQTTDELVRDTNAAQWRSWLLVAATMAVMCMLLFGLVRRGSQTIVAQRRELHERVAELSTLLERNAQLDARVRGSAARATAINERFLRRISAGLQLPEIDGLAVDEIAGRAVRDYERKTGAKVALATAGDAVDVSLPVKITLYRLLQESLANGYRHARGIDQRVVVSVAANELTVEISDGGPGFDTRETVVDGRIGLAGMRERIQALGGSFELRSSPGHGTTIKAFLPTQVPGGDDE